MQFIDLKTQQLRIRDKIDANIKKVLDHGQYILGPEVTEIEQKLADYCGVNHAIACSSGTDALLLALMAYSVGPGDVVFTTPFTFFATAEVIGLLGAIPVFVDIDPKTYNINPDDLEKAIMAVQKKDPEIYPLPDLDLLEGATAKGIMPVNLFGLPADYDRINAIAKKYDLFVIEDAAQSFGAEYKGKKSCSLGDIGCTSFFPAKPLGCYGDGGMCFTDSDEVEKALRSLLVHGQGTDKYENVRLGINGRMDSMQAAILLAKFDIYEDEIELRQRVAEKYNELFGQNTDIVIPFIPKGYRSVWAQYSLLVKDGAERSRIMTQLASNEIPSAIYYPKPLHRQTAFQFLKYNDKAFPVSENCADRIFSLPMHPYLTEKEQKTIMAAVNPKK